MVTLPQYGYPHPKIEMACKDVTKPQFSRCARHTVLTHLSNCDQSSLIADFSRQQLASRFSQQPPWNAFRLSSREKTSRVTSASKQAQGTCMRPPPHLTPTHAGGLARGSRGEKVVSGSLFSIWIKSDVVLNPNFLKLIHDANKTETF